MNWKGAKGAATAMLVAVLCLPGAARADEAEALLEEGLVRLRVGKFKKSLKVLKRALRKAKVPGIKARVQLNLGVVYAVLRKKRRARKVFTAALKLDPTVTLKKGEVKDKALSLFEEIRSKIKGTLTVKADVAGATVLVDGKRVGTVQVMAKVVVGRHKVEVVSSDGMSRFEVEVVIGAGQQREVMAKLEFVGCKLTVASQPEGAKVLVDGKEVGITPLQGANVTAGDHEIRVVKDGYEPHVAKVKGVKGGSIPLALTLKSLSTTTPAPAPATQATTPAPSPAPVVDDGGKRRFPLWTVVLGAAALGAAGAGIGMGVVSDSAFEDYQETGSQQDYWDLRDKVSAMETGANVSFIAAGVLAAGAAAVYLLWERHPSREQAPATENVPDTAPAATW